MSMRIDDFKAKLQGGGARPNLFRIILPFPTYAVVGGETSELSFLCKGAQLPAATIGVIEVPWRGRQVKIAGDRTFEEWTITVINDTDFLIKNAFERWSNQINEHLENTGLINPTDYESSAVIEQLDRNENVLKRYSMVGMWPSEVSSIEVSMDSTDEIEEFTVTLQYQYWTSDTTT